MLKLFVITCLLFVKSWGFWIDGKEYDIYESSENGVLTTVIHRPSSSPEDSWIARSAYNKSYRKTGWDTLQIETNPSASEDEQTYFAGYVEGLVTSEAIYDHWYNTVREACVNETQICDQINEYLIKNVKWLIPMIYQYSSTDVYWRQIKYFHKQLAGLIVGYNKVAPRSKKLLGKDIAWMNFMWDISELKSALKNESNRALKGDDHCSALIKILHGQSDVLVAHNTWTGYQTMRRIVKRYTLPLKDVSGISVSFSGYPGALVSGDDFYIINNGLVALETTIGNNNNSLWAHVKPEGQMLEVIRVFVANRLAQGGRSWAKIFSQYNSGTYNNQWMIVDMKKFSPGSIRPELLWVVEQIPGYIRQEDQTDLLLRQGYWASYNVPFYPDIFNMSGNQEMVHKFGDYFTYDKNPRAQIFKRDQDKVTDIDSMMNLMRYNDYQHDPLSKCDCDPPYSAEIAIAARCDLNPLNGTYPFPALSHRSHGATDAKVTNYRLSQDLSMLAVSGPSTGTHLPPFQWSKSDYNLQLSHRGHPDLFNFSPGYITWHNHTVTFPSVHLVP